MQLMVAREGKDIPFSGIATLVRCSCSCKQVNEYESRRGLARERKEINENNNIKGGNKKE